MPSLSSAQDSTKITQIRTHVHHLTLSADTMEWNIVISGGEFLMFLAQAGSRAGLGAAIVWPCVHLRHLMTRSALSAFVLPTTMIRSPPAIKTQAPLHLPR